MSILIFKTHISHTLKNLSLSHLFHKSHFDFSFSLLFSSSASRKTKNPFPICEYLEQKHQFSPQTVSKAASVLSHLKTPKKCDLVLSYLKEAGFSKTNLENFVVVAPHVLCASLDQTIKPKIKIFQDLGFSTADMVDIVSHNPWVLMHSADKRIGPALFVLKNVLGSVTGVAKVLKVSGWFFKYDLEKTLLPNIEFLKNCGIDAVQLTNHIYNFPRFFLNRPESVRKYVGKVDGMGFDKSSKLYLYAITAVGSMTDTNWEQKLELFRSLGFSNDDIASMFKKRPQVFAVSSRKIREVVQVVLNTGKYDLSVIAKHPGLFLASIEDRLKPRFQVLAILEKKNILGRRPGLSSIYVITDKKFIARFVSPNLKQLGKIHLTKQVNVRRKC